MKFTISMFRALLILLLFSSAAYGILGAAQASAEKLTFGFVFGLIVLNLLGFITVGIIHPPKGRMKHLLIVSLIWYAPNFIIKYKLFYDSTKTLLVLAAIFFTFPIIAFLVSKLNDIISSYIENDCK